MHAAGTASSDQLLTLAGIHLCTNRLLQRMVTGTVALPPGLKRVSDTPDRRLHRSNAGHRNSDDWAVRLPKRRQRQPAAGKCPARRGGAFENTRSSLQQRGPADLRGSCVTIVDPTDEFG